MEDKNRIKFVLIFWNEIVLYFLVFEKISNFLKLLTLGRVGMLFYVPSAEGEYYKSCKKQKI